MTSSTASTGVVPTPSTVSARAPFQGFALVVPCRRPVDRRGRSPRGWPRKSVCLGVGAPLPTHPAAVRAASRPRTPDSGRASSKSMSTVYRARATVAVRGQTADQRPSGWTGRRVHRASSPSAVRRVDASGVVQGRPSEKRGRRPRNRTPARVEDPRDDPPCVSRRANVLLEGTPAAAPPAPGADECDSYAPEIVRGRWRKPDT